MKESKADASLLAAALRDAGVNARPREDCPPADRIWAAVRLELPLQERGEIIDHTIVCPTCAEAWRLAKELVSPAEAPDNVTPIRSELSTWAIPWLRAAAAAMIVVVAALWFSIYRPAKDPTNRGPIQSLVERSRALPRENFVLRWSGGPSNARYDLVATSDLEALVNEPGLERPEYRIPAERLSGLPPGSRVQWRVTARGQDGDTVSSPTFATLVE